MTDVHAIDKVDRFREPPEKGILTDLLWADPFDEKEEAISKDYEANDLRNISVRFGLKPAKAILKKEKLLAIVRAH